MFSESLKKTLEELKTRNALFNAVIEDLADEEDMEDMHLMAVFDDITRHGCISGCVPSMIYYEDTIRFFNTYKSDINEELALVLEQTGLTMEDYFGTRFDMKDPLCIETSNMNLLAWWAYEHVCNEVLDMWDAD